MLLLAILVCINVSVFVLCICFLVIDCWFSLCVDLPLYSVLVCVPCFVKMFVDMVIETSFVISWDVTFSLLVKSIVVRDVIFGSLVVFNDWVDSTPVLCLSCVTVWTVYLRVFNSVPCFVSIVVDILKEASFMVDFVDQN